MTVRSAVLLAAATLLPAAAYAQALGASAVVTGGRTGRVVADGALWNCESGRCAGASRGGRFGDARACADLAVKAGRVLSFSGSSGVMAADGLAACNKRARAAK